MFSSSWISASHDGCTEAALARNHFQDLWRISCRCNGAHHDRLKNADLGYALRQLLQRFEIEARAVRIRNSGQVKRDIAVALGEQFVGDDNLVDWSRCDWR
jgi:hypothetical protein